jgi:hypothetical protein
VESGGLQFEDIMGKKTPDPTQKITKAKRAGVSEVAQVVEYLPSK